MNGKQGKVTLDHGGGGRASRELVQGYFLPRFTNPFLGKLDDSAVVNFPPVRLAVTTDCYVVDPIFFPGGDIGMLAVNGTVNDLSVQGAKPLFLSAAFILEEGFELADLERILISMARASREADVSARNAQWRRAAIPILPEGRSLVVGAPVPTTTTSFAKSRKPSAYMG